MRACAMAIGGLDPGGGAGIAADLRAFRATGVFGCAVVAVITVQSTDGLRSATALSPRLVVAQAAEVVRVQRVRALKLGALGSRDNVRAVAKWIADTVTVPVVLDPVMVPTRGASRLLEGDALHALRDELLPRAALVTANAPEAATLTGEPVTTLAEARRAARRLVAMGAQAALVKGGHLALAGEAVDVLVIGRKLVELSSRRLALGPTHGGGCVLASLIAGLLARRRSFALVPDVEGAVRRARGMHQRALQNAVDVGGAMRVLMP